MKCYSILSGMFCINFIGEHEMGNGEVENSPSAKANMETLWLNWKTEKCNVIESKPDGKCNEHYFQNRAR